MALPSRVASDFLDRASQSATSTVLPATLEAEFVSALLAKGRVLDALERCSRRLSARLSELASFNDARTAEAMVPLVRAAIDGGDTALATSLKSEFSRLLTRGSDEDWVTAVRAAEAIGERAMVTRGPGADSSTRLVMDLRALEELRGRDDPAWKTLFDSIEDRLDSIESHSEHQEALDSYLRCGLVRAAYRQWGSAGKPESPELVEALWRDQLLHQYRTVVDSGLPRSGDWGAVGSGATLAKAQLRAGDVEGARMSAKVVRDVAEAGVAEVLAIPTTISPRTGRTNAPHAPAIAIWYLAHLIPLEVARGEQTASRAVLRRCESLLEQNETSRARPADRAQGRVTALIALVRACVEAKWFDEALRFACLQKDSVESQALVAFESGSVEFAERVFEALPVEGRVRLAVLACAVSDSEP